MDKILKLTFQTGFEKSKVSNLFSSTRGAESEDQSSKVLSAFKTFEIKSKPKQVKERLLTEETASAFGNDPMSPDVKTSRALFVSSVLGSVTGKKQQKPPTTDTAAQSHRSNTDEQTPLKTHGSAPNIRLDALYSFKSRYPVNYRPALVCTGEYWRKEKNQQDLKREHLVQNKYLDGYMIPRELKRLQSSCSRELGKSVEVPDTDDYFSKVISEQLDQSKASRSTKQQQTMIEYNQ